MSTTITGVHELVDNLERVVRRSEKERTEEVEDSDLGAVRGGDER